MSGTAPLLIEIGCEEIPAGVAPELGRALQAALAGLLNSAGVDAGRIQPGVTPRRLLLHAGACPLMQPDREEIIWGPPERVAFAGDEPTKAAEGFARKAGLPLAAFALVDKGDGKGRYMRAVRRVTGCPVREIIAAAMPDILRKLPSPRQMRWQDGEYRDDAFIRPVRWIVARLGDDIIPFSFAGVRAGPVSQGHRVHGSSGEMDIHNPFAWLEKQYVLAERGRRRQDIAGQLATAAAKAGVELIEDNELLEEVTDLTEWPQVVTGRYDVAFLRLPEEVSRIELKHHQRCFAARNRDGGASHVFFAVANVTSKKPAVVVHGNERVVNARLADAAFYFDRDPRESLEARVERLSDVVLQEGLGMVGDQVRRLRAFVLDNARALGVDANDAQRAAYLCKSDLTTGLVGEFPELQGYMGGIYARLDGESEAVATGITGHYAPAGADDTLPSSRIARAIGIAERADKLLGYFHIGRAPSASADPFGLRRAAIGLIRLLAAPDMPVTMTLSEVLDESAKQWNQQRVTIAIPAGARSRVRDFILERWLGMSPASDTRKALAAALHASVERPMVQVAAVTELLASFAGSEAGRAVATANKRIANILKKAEKVDVGVDVNLFTEAAEERLFSALQKAESGLPEDPAGMLAVLAALREPVDVFFDEVLVMAEDGAVRTNRLALLSRLRALFLRLADVSCL